MDSKVKRVNRSTRQTGYESSDHYIGHPPPPPPPIPPAHMYTMSAGLLQRSRTSVVRALTAIRSEAWVRFPVATQAFFSISFFYADLPPVALSTVLTTSGQYRYKKNPVNVRM